jgi:hypothetical protein
MADKTLDPNKFYLTPGKVYGPGRASVEDLAKERKLQVGTAQAAPLAPPTQTATVSAAGRLQQAAPGGQGEAAQVGVGAFDPFEPEATRLRDLEVAISDLDEETVKAAQGADTRAGAAPIYEMRLRDIREAQGGGQE